MSTTRRIRSIYCKELVDILRDRRTLIAMIVVPIVLYPLLMVVFANAAGDQAGQISAESVLVGVRSEADVQTLAELIRNDHLALRTEQGFPPLAPGANLMDETELPARSLRDTGYHVVPDGDLERAIREREVHVGIDFPPDRVDENGRGPVQIRLYVLDELIRSRVAGNRLQMMIQRINDRLSPNPYETSEVSLTTPSSILSLILPLILILMTITGAIYPAIDLTAGERERGTLESLMVCPVPVRDLIVGKFLVVTTVALAGAALNLASVSATVYFGGFSELINPPIGRSSPQTDSVGGDVPRNADDRTDGTDKTDRTPYDAEEPGFPLAALPLILATLVPFAILMSAIMLAVCACARTFKEAQNYVTPVILAVLVPGGMAALPGTELRGGMLVMPVANMVLLTRDLLRGPSVVPLASITWVLLSTCMYAVSAVALATKVFGIESVVFADSGSIRTTFLRRFIRSTPRPSLTLASLLVALLLPVWFYVQTGLSAANHEDLVPLLKSTAMLMPVCFVLVPILVLLYWKVDVVETLALHATKPRYLIAGILVGLSSWIPAHELVALIADTFGVPAALERMDELLNDSLATLSAPMIFLIIALVPAICEELLFRGTLLSSFRDATRRWPAIVVVAAAFAVFHMTFFRLPVTFGLGLVLGYLCWQAQSIWPSILAHGLHNGILASFVVWPTWQGKLGIASDDPWGHLPLPLIAAGVIVLAAGLYLARDRAISRKP